MNEERKGILAMALCAVLWSSAGILIKLIPWNGMALSGFRSLIAMTVMYGFLRYRKVPLQISRVTLSIACFHGATCILFVMANKLTTSANAIVLQQCTPAAVLLYGVFIQKQKFRPMDYLVVLLTFVGIGICFLDRLDSGGMLGNLCAITAGLTFAGNYICSAAASEAERLNGLLQAQALSALIGLPFALVYGVTFSLASVLSILALGVFQIGLSFLLYAYAAQRAKPLTCSLLGVLEPVLNPVWVLLFNGEVPGPFALAGGVLVIAAVAGWCVYNEKAAAKSRAAVYKTL